MAHEARPITVHALPEAARLAREVNETGKARLVQFGGDVVRLTPTRRRPARTGKQPTPAAIEAALAVAGAWEGWLDAEKFKRDRRELQEDNKPVRPL